MLGLSATTINSRRRPLGYSSISITWDQTGSSTGPHDFIVQYSLDGSSFTTTGAQYSVQSTANFWTAGTHYQEYNGSRTSISTSLANQSIVYFRLVDNSTTSNNGGTVSTAGTDRVDNFKILGIAPLANPTYWNGNGSGGGSGTWNTSNTNWNTLANGTGSASAFDSSKAAIFGNTAGTVTVSGAGGVTANGGIEFDSSGYVITGTTLTLGTTSTIQVTGATDTGTINAPIAGFDGMTIAGSGTTVLGGTNTFQGNVSINGASLSISHNSNLGDANNAVTISSGTFKITNDVSMPSSRNLTLDGTGTVDVAATKTLTVTGSANGGDLVLSNSGKLNLSGSHQVDRWCVVQLQRHAAVR